MDHGSVAFICCLPYRACTQHTVRVPSYGRIVRNLKNEKKNRKRGKSVWFRETITGHRRILADFGCQTDRRLRADKGQFHRRAFQKTTVNPHDRSFPRKIKTAFRCKISRKVLRPGQSRLTDVSTKLF